MLCSAEGRPQFSRALCRRTELSSVYTAKFSFAHLLVFLSSTFPIKILYFQKKFILEKENCQVQSSPQRLSLSVAILQASPFTSPAVYLISELDKTCLSRRRWEKLVKFSCKFTLNLKCCQIWLLNAMQICSLETRKHDTLC